MPTAEIGNLPVITVTSTQTVRPTWSAGGDVAAYANAVISFTMNAAKSDKVVANGTPPLKYAIYTGGSNTAIDCGNKFVATLPAPSIIALWCPRIGAILVSAIGMSDPAAVDDAFYQFLWAITNAGTSDKTTFGCHLGLIYRSVVAMQPQLFSEVTIALNNDQWGGDDYNTAVLAFLKGNCKPNV